MNIDDMVRRHQLLVHLIGVGEMPGTPAGELQVGDRLMWNYGSVYKVKSVRDVSACFVEIVEHAESGTGTDKDYTRKLRKDRLVVRARQGERWPRATTIGAATRAMFASIQ